MMECCQIISILHHEKPPIIHRDIKPENFVWEESSQTLVLIDIDAGRQFTPSKTRDTVLPEHMVMPLQSNSVSDKAISVPMYKG